MMETGTATQPVGARKDYLYGALAGFFIGLLLMPILHTAKPDLYQSLRLALVPVFTVLVPLGLVIASWLARPFPVIWQIAKFVVIGVLNALVDIGLLAYMLNGAARSPYRIASDDLLFTLFVPIAFYSLYKSLSFIVANVNSYYWNKYWTFENTAAGKSGSQFVQFFVVSLVGFFINVITASSVSAAFHTTGSLSPEQWGLVGAVAGSLTGLVWNFVGYKFIVFKK